MNTEESNVTPEADLAALEQRAIDGEPVTPEELTNARERVTLAGLFRKGQAARQEAAERLAAAERQQEAKNAAAALLAENNDLAERATAEILASVSALVSAVSERNSAIEEAARILERAGLPVPDDSIPNILDVAGIDLNNFVRWGHGMELQSITVAGISHAPARASQRVQRALSEAVQAVDLGHAVEVKERPR